MGGVKLYNRGALAGILHSVHPYKDSRTLWRRYQKVTCRHPHRWLLAQFPQNSSLVDGSVCLPAEWAWYHPKIPDIWDPQEGQCSLLLFMAPWGHNSFEVMLLELFPDTVALGSSLEWGFSSAERTAEELWSLGMQKHVRNLEAFEKYCAIKFGGFKIDSFTGK